MERINDQGLINILISEDETLNHLVRQHKTLESQIELFNKRRFLTPHEQAEKKHLQKLKLMEKDKIEKILGQYKRNERVIF